MTDISENEDKLGDNSGEKIIEVYKKIFYEKVLEEIKPIRGILEQRDLTQRFIEIVYGEELRRNVEEIKLRLSGIGSELERKLSEDERKYLAGVLYLKKRFSEEAYPSISAFVYEILRSAGLISDEDRRRRSEIAKFVFNDLVKKGYIIETELDYDTRHEALPKIRYAYTLALNDEMPISEIQKFDAYRKLENNQVRIEDDREFKRTLKRYKKAIVVIRTKIMQDKNQGINQENKDTENQI